jgi:glycosyltransferase involved in cell wall biosynthesis
MELASIKLSRILSQECSVHLLVKNNSFLHLNSQTLLQNSNVQLHTVDFNHFFSINLIWQTRSILKKYGIKNIIFLGASEMRSLYFATLGIELNFIIRQGSKKSTPKKDFFHRLIYSNITTFVGNSEFMKRNIEEILPVPSSALVTRIYASLNLPTEIVQKTSNGTISIVQSGRIQPGKGQLDTIKGCSILYENNIPFELTFLGDYTANPEFYTKLQHYLTSCPYAEKVKFIGHTADVSGFLQKNDIFVLPSQGEGMSNAIIEALGHGLVTIIYNNTSSPEFLNLGFNLHLVEDNSFEDMKTLLLNVSKNLLAEKECARKNIFLSQKIFSPEREKQDYLALLD